MPDIYGNGRIQMPNVMDAKVVDASFFANQINNADYEPQAHSLRAHRHGAVT